MLLRAIGKVNFLAFIILAVLCVPHVTQAADDFTFASTTVGGSYSLSGAGTPNWDTPYTAASSFSASSTLTFRFHMKRDTATASFAGNVASGNFGPSVFFIADSAHTSGSTACLYRYFFTQADMDAMKAAYDASSYATFSIVMPQQHFGSTCSYTTSTKWRWGFTSINQTANTASPPASGTGTFGATSYWETDTSSAFQGTYVQINAVTAADSTSTRIVSFSPDEGATVSGPGVDINEHIYINPDDLSGQLGIRLTLHNIDQNVLLLGFLSPGDITVFDGEATTSGDVFLGGHYALADGNYRLNATLTRSYLYGWVINPFSSIDQDQSHQFVVGTSTFIGTLTQNGYNEFNGILASTTATSTANLAKNCNPLTFDITYCLSFLFIPGGPQLQQTFVTFRDDVLTRKPWGYFGRAYAIMSASSTAALPSFTASFQIGPPDNLATTSLAFDPGDMLAGAATLLTNTRDPQAGKNMRDVFEPLVQLTIALAVIFTIFADLTGSHRHHSDDLARR